MAIHDLTFTDWDNYTDGDGNAFTLDWTDVAAMTRQFVYPYVEAIRQAVAERVEVSDTSATFATFPVALDSPVLSGQWMGAVIKGSIQYLRMSSRDDLSYYMRNTSFNWVPPADIGTMHDTEEYYHTALDGKRYSGSIWDSLFWGGAGIAQWTPAVTKMLDDAGITDTTFRTWWLQIVGDNPVRIEGGSVAIALLFPFAEVLRNIKLLVSLLVQSVEVRNFPVGSTYEDDLDFVSGDIKSITEPGYSWSTAVSLFNAASWVSDTSVFPTHRANYTGNGIEMKRVRSTMNVGIRGGAKRDVRLLQEMSLKVGSNLYWGRPYFQPNDFIGVTGIRTGGEIRYPGRWVYGTVKEYAAQTANLVETFGDFGNTTLTQQSFYSTGWYTQKLMIQQDFNVTNGFTFR